MILEKLLKNLKSVNFCILVKTVKIPSFFFFLGKNLKEENTMWGFAIKNICKDLLISQN